MLERDALIATVTKAQAGDRLAMNELFCHLGFLCFRLKA